MVKIKRKMQTKMSHKKISYIKSLLHAKLTSKRKLMSLSLCVTNRCNLRCIYCYGDYFYRKAEDLPLADIFYIIDCARDSGLRHLFLTGGEPLLRKDIGEIVDYAHAFGIVTGMVSNGLLLPRRIHKLKNLGKIIFSLDGKREVNDKNRGQGSYEKVMKAVRCCESHGLPFDFKMVLNRTSKTETEHMLELAAIYNSRLEVVFAYSPKSALQRSQHGHLMLDFEEVKYFSRKLLGWKKAGRPLMFPLPAYENMAIWHNAHDKGMLTKNELKPDFPYIKCNAGVYHAFIDGDGFMYPCNQVIGDFPAMHIIKDGFPSAWQNLQDHSCCACSVPFLTHQNLTHDLYLGYQPKKMLWILKGKKYE